MWTSHRTKQLVLVVAVVAVLAGIGLYATRGFQFSVLPSQGYERGFAYSGDPSDFSFPANCEAVESTIQSALYGIPKDKFDAGLDLSESYIQVTQSSVLNSANSMYVGRTARTGLDYSRIGENPYALLAGSDSSSYGWSYGLSGVVPFRVLDPQSTIPGTCTITYHLAFNAPQPQQAVPEEPPQTSVPYQPPAAEQPAYQQPAACSVYTPPDCLLWQDVVYTTDPMGCVTSATCRTDQVKLNTAAAVSVLLMALSAAYVYLGRRKK
jgi:hypothetical protein